MQELDKDYNGYYYKISDILTILICGVLCGLQNISDIYEWSKAAPVREFFFNEFRIRKLPSRAQFYNIIGCVNPEKFNNIFIEWVKTLLPEKISGKTIAIDGKTICSTDKLTEDNTSLHILTAIVSETNLILGSRECDTKISEPQALRELVEILDVSGAIIVADALHCQKKSAEKIIEEGGEYVFVVKDNIPTLKKDIELYVQNEEMEEISKTEKNGGRIEKRTAYVTQDIDWLTGKEKWKDLKTIGAIHTEFTKGETTSSEWHYYISSAELSAEELLKHARLEWAVESMHWLLDVHYQEDKTKVWDMNIQKTLNILRKIGLNLARDYKNKYEPRKAISGILKRNLFDINNLSEFIRFILALNNVTELILKGLRRKLCKQYLTTFDKVKITGMSLI